MYIVTSLQASFSVSTNRSDIDIDDPNFWQKWAKKAELDVDELTNKVTSVWEYVVHMFVK